MEQRDLLGFMSAHSPQQSRNYSTTRQGGACNHLRSLKIPQYLYGHPFTIVTYHKPLLSLFNEMKAIPQIVSLPESDVGP
uniref:Reverse transcriptase RNase H-like domain-containing protein n=1 Tax=Anguilla anguilla TaxID=7936 RepID=A0A0E9U5X0_ANGAN